MRNTWYKHFKNIIYKLGLPMYCFDIGAIILAYFATYSVSRFKIMT